jgi:hypothetical protein
MGDTVPQDAHEPTREWVREWRGRWKSKRPDTLSYRRTLHSVLIGDRRNGDGATRTHAFAGAAARIYEHCGDSMRTADQLAAHLAADGLGCSAAELANALTTYCELGLMLEENRRYLSLALPVTPRS